MKFKMNGKLTKTIATISAIAVVGSVSATYAVGGEDSVSKALVDQLVQMVTNERNQNEQLNQEIHNNNMQMDNNLTLLREVYRAIGMGNISDEEILRKNISEIGMDMDTYIQGVLEMNMSNASASGAEGARLELANILGDILGTQERDLDLLLNEVGNLQMQIRTLQNQNMVMQEQMGGMSKDAQELAETTDYLRQQIINLGEQPVR